MAWRAVAAVVIILLVVSAFYLNDMISSAKRISVDVERVELVSAGLQAATVNVTLVVKNPSKYRYSAEEVRYEVYVEDVKIGNGTIEKLEIPPGSTYQSSLMTLYYSELGRAVISFLTQGKIDVNINGTAKIKVLFFPVEVKFSERRTIRP